MNEKIKSEEVNRKAVDINYLNIYCFLEATTDFNISCIRQTHKRPNLSIEW